MDLSDNGWVGDISLRRSVKKSRGNTNLWKIGSGLKSRHLSSGDKGHRRWSGVMNSLLGQCVADFFLCEAFIEQIA
jgi:hypothetical protein